MEEETAAQDAAVGGYPQRELRDPRELRALAHPLRLHLLEELAGLGEATATELADRVGQTPANCSWHLRQLAKYGFIEEAGGGTGRQRPWRWVPQSTRITHEQDASPTLRLAREAAVDMILDREVESWRDWRATRDAAPQAWQDASFAASNINWMTLEELEELKQDINAVIERHVLAHLDRPDPARRPAGASLVRFVAWGFPAGPAAELPDPATAAQEAAVAHAESGDDHGAGAAGEGTEREERA